MSDHDIPIVDCAINLSYNKKQLGQVTYTTLKRQTEKNIMRRTTSGTSY